MRSICSKAHAVILVIILLLSLNIIPKCHCNDEEDKSKLQEEETTTTTTCQMEKNNNDSSGINTCIATDTNESSSSLASTPSTPSSSSSSRHNHHHYQFPGCRLFLAPSTIQSPNAGLGIFTTRSLKRGQPITFPDIIIQINDYHVKKKTKINNNYEKYNNFIGPLLNQYSWDAQSFGGQYEGQNNRIASILPGIGSLSNAQTTFAYSNTIPYRPDVDEANVPRTDVNKPGAGSFTHYHNLTFFASRDVQSGDEIFVYYDYYKNKKDMEEEDDDDDNWWKERVNTTEYNQIINIQNNYHLHSNDPKNPNKQQQQQHNHQRDINWLTKNGICLDNIKVSRSKIKGAGRGAFATRFIPKGSIVAPLPLVVIPHRDALKIDTSSSSGSTSTTKEKRKKKNKIVINDQQLILNYCFGHENSTLLLYPISPGVNLVNHAPTVLGKEEEVTSDGIGSKEQTPGKKKKVPPTANVKLQWSTSSFSESDDFNKNFPSLEEIRNNPYSTNLMMEFIATRDIQPKEEIYLDYGQKWMEAWSKHSRSWTIPPDAKSYSPAYVMEDVAGLLRTESEQIDHPYPPNLDISCFYQYSTYHQKKNNGIVASKTTSSETTTVKWQMDRKTFEFKNLRPCHVVSREKMTNGHWMYTVQMKNRAGLPKKEMIPKGELHVVSSVPRGAIRFTDKIHSTDQHLPNAFRHEIGIPHDIFPKDWIDLNVDDLETM